MEVNALFRTDDRDATIQLQQLAGLPSLSSVSLLDSSCPTLFLNALGTQLTGLHLDASYREVQPGTQTPTPAWLATLQHTARFTALQSLTISCVTSEELGTVAPAVRQLRRLHLNGPLPDVDGDAVVERLLNLPHLTSLRWDSGHVHTPFQRMALQRSHASSPCRWKELLFGFVTPHQLARLPLHSLTSPVSWQYLVVDERSSVAEVQAAADNATRRCPAGWLWRSEGAAGSGMWPSVLLARPTRGDMVTWFTRGAGEGDTPAALLRALQPLLAGPGLTQLGVAGLAWDVELVRVLGQVWPRTCTGLGLARGSLSLPACLHLAASISWVQALHLIDMALHPQGVMAYVAAAAGRVQGTGVGPALTSVCVVRPVRPEDRSEEAWREAWEEVRQAVESMSVGVEVELHW